MQALDAGTIGPFASTLIDVCFFAFDFQKVNTDTPLLDRRQWCTFQTCGESEAESCLPSRGFCSLCSRSR